MEVNALLASLDGVREKGPDQWQALCPAHNDRSPSLSIRRVDDRLLIHCFAGCSPAEVVNSVGLSVADLFEGRPEPCKSGRAYRPRIDYRAVLRAVRHEIEVIALAAEDVVSSKCLDADDLATVRRARANIRKALEATNV